MYIIKSHDKNLDKQAEFAGGFKYEEEARQKAINLDYYYEARNNFSILEVKDV